MAYGRLQESALNAYANFGNFFRAMLVLLRCLTGEGWETFMFACQHNHHGSPGAVAMFLTYMIFANFVIANLFIMIVVDQYEELGVSRDGMSDKDVAAFNAIWSIYDPTGTRFIKVGRHAGCFAGTAAAT